MSAVPNIRGPLGLKAGRVKSTKRKRADRSDAIRKSAAGEDCALCLPGYRHDPATVVFCHVRTPGDGIGRKPADWFGYYGCFDCHREEEAGRVNYRDVLIAVASTQRKLAAKGLLSIG